MSKNRTGWLVKGTALLLWVMVCSSPAASGQDTDSLYFVKPAWKKEKVAKGVFLVNRQFFNKSLFGSNQYISYVIIKIKKEERVQYSSGGKRTKNDGGLC